MDDIILTRADGAQFLHGHGVEVVSNLGDTPESQTSSQARRNWQRLLEEGARRYPDLEPYVAAELVAANEEGILTDSEEGRATPEPAEVFAVDSAGVVQLAIPVDPSAPVDPSQVVQGIPVPTGLPDPVYLSSDDGHEGTGGWILPDGTIMRTLGDGAQVC